ncbi:hypothetical protein C5E22_21175 [Pectobacterium parmentieri]|uniref:Uncharacterized protein n=1 Tax=Pectobacterium parmentieri TaxID=1905730 RepID=A0A8B3FFB1_PECPM|nr:hypothetical protein C5E25_01575 [Pectobacterium parmentieri]AYH08491.1 hypothetical protein C5E24_01445 [Pectobacterium parmentieri]AYH13007.1 hypothetical protein C5E23_01560 [Pectobacterium parmentieri]AYH20766.1 hypothetical protein C5E22_21175 [Pectobacterium parmentieri]AYH21709.1 hypothetical protein C5E21_01555 [Pectobacterium parmentieri]
MHVRWLRLATRITYLSKLIGTPSLAAYLKLELFRAYFSTTHTVRVKMMVSFLPLIMAEQ